MAGRPAPVRQLRGASCLSGCSFGGPTKSHHDRLLSVDRDPDGMLDLLELALTWDELDYEAHSLIEPPQWEHFLVTHRWRDRAQAARIFGLATDVAMRAGWRTTGAPPSASVFSALTGQPAAVVPEPVVPELSAARR